MECLSYCIANSIDLTRLDNHFKNTLIGYSSVRARDVLRLNHCDEPDALVFVFKNGTIVTWGVKRYAINTYLEIIRPFGDKLVTFLVRDEFSYQIGDKTAIRPMIFSMWIA